MTDDEIAKKLKETERKLDRLTSHPVYAKFQRRFEFLIQERAMWMCAMRDNFLKANGIEPYDD